MKRRFAIELLPDIGWDELRRRVLHSEELGFELVATADQFVDWKNPSVPWFDPWATLAAFAEATSTIRMAPYVAQIPMRDQLMKYGIGYAILNHILAMIHVSFICSAESKVQERPCASKKSYDKV